MTSKSQHKIQLLISCKKASLRYLFFFLFRDYTHLKVNQSFMSAQKI